MQDIYKTFEFNRIQETISDYAKTEIGKEKAMSLTMLTDPKEIQSLLDYLNEMMSIYQRFGELPIATSANALKLIEMAKKTALLSPRDLSLIADDVLTSNRVKKFLNKIDLNYPLISKECEKFFDLDNLEKEIHRVITSSLTVDDKATPELKEIRTKMKKLEATLIQKSASLSLSYSQYLSDGNATIRDGHYVLPVKTAMKSRVSGIIYDVSDTGNTTFIEPLEIVQLNNQITELKVQENDEVRKILKSLTALVLIQENEILQNNAVIGELDFLLAKSKYACQINGVVATLSETQIIELTDARHPLINPEKVISNTYTFNEHSHIIIISGPNAGGKTVSLKTVGLFVLMNQCGLAVPATKAKLSVFNHIYLDIGDNQSLSDNLSTFSAHIYQVSEILSLVKGKDLVLFDELGTGTDPKEGEAIALATLKYLEYKHCFAMISSHFSKLKEYAFSSTGIENSSMIFDEEKLLPTYLFKQGVPGKSYGIDVASRFPLPKEVIDEAKAIILEENKTDSDTLLNVLQEKMSENERLSRELKMKESALEKENKRLENEANLLKERKEHLLESVNKEKAQIIADTEEKIDAILKEMQSGEKKMHEVIQLKKQVTDLMDDIKEVQFDETIRLHDYVSYPSLNLEGKITRISGKKGTMMTNDGMSVEVSLDKVTKIDAPEEKAPVNKTNYENRINTNIGLELNIIGLRRDEALDKLTKYIDACRVKHLGNVRIIHGFGSGILRKMTQEYLSKQKDLTYRSGDAYEGGSGATVVIFKTK